MGNQQTHIKNDGNKPIYVTIKYHGGNSTIKNKEVLPGDSVKDIYGQGISKLTVTVEGPLGTISKDIPPNKEFIVRDFNKRYDLADTQSVNIKCCS